jgi:hypothetical protein
VGSTGYVAYETGSTSIFGTYSGTTVIATNFVSSRYQLQIGDTGFGTSFALTGQTVFYPFSLTSQIGSTVGWGTVTLPTGMFTFPKLGWYLVSYSFPWYGATAPALGGVYTTPSISQSWLCKNGATVGFTCQKYGFSSILTGVTGGVLSTTGTAIMQATSLTDTVSLTVWSNTPTRLWFSALDPVLLSIQHLHE